MIEQDGKAAQEPRNGQHVSAEDEDVRVTMEQSRQALAASAAEIERSKRLLRETRELGNLAVPPPVNFSDDGESS